MHKLSILLLAAAPLFAQLESHTVSITASRSIALAADQFVLGLTVTSPASATLDQIVAALSPFGITSANLTGVYSPTPSTFQWSFTLAAPLSSLTSTLASLAKLQQTITQNHSGLTLTFLVNGTQASAQQQQTAQSQSCDDAGLIAAARVQAQTLATAAGFTLGPVLGVSTTPQPGLAPARAGFAFFTLGAYLSTIPYTTPQPLAVTCSLTLQFQLLP